MNSSITISIYPNKNFSSSQIKKLINCLYQEAKKEGIIIRFHDQVTELLGDYKKVTDFFHDEILKFSKIENILEMSFKINVKLDF